MNATVRVRSRGTITLPAELRKKYSIEYGDLFNLVDLDGVFVLSPVVPMVPELAREIEKIRLEAGLSIEELLQELQTQRERCYQERYGSKAESQDSY
jgi:bifunctional DNA-binding transcriptional regulator/antitoxin component of YhaV-PrlF toxin-antitoxin module